MAQAQVETQAIHPNCLNGNAVTKEVTHYMVPLLEAYNHQTCDLMEGTCIYKKNGVQFLHNYGYQDEPLSSARCKNGYGNRRNCLNPCRTVAASMRHHRFGQVLFLKELVGKKCGNLERDGFEMIHDGFVVVADTGAESHFNATGRFDFFWGRCANRRNGICREGAQPISDATTRSSYCMVWDPARPALNQDLKDAFVSKVKAEALERGDVGAAEDFKL
jgi:hypothetical protein